MHERIVVGSRNRATTLSAAAGTVKDEASFTMTAIEEWLFPLQDVRDSTPRVSNGGEAVCGPDLTDAAVRPYGQSTPSLSSIQDMMSTRRAVRRQLREDLCTTRWSHGVPGVQASRGSNGVRSSRRTWAGCSTASRPTP